MRRRMNMEVTTCVLGVYVSVPLDISSGPTRSRAAIIDRR